MHSLSSLPDSRSDTRTHGLVYYSGLLTSILSTPLTPSSEIFPSQKSLILLHFPAKFFSIITSVQGETTYTRIHSHGSMSYAHVNVLSARSKSAHTAGKALEYKSLSLVYKAHYYGGTLISCLVTAQAVLNYSWFTKNKHFIAMEFVLFFVTGCFNFTDSSRQLFLMLKLCLSVYINVTV